jgi:inhibitor of KinA sporulation pathway (predicted exonuclease)
MGGALRHLGLPLEGTHHRGGDDAWNIAAILAWCLRQPGVTLESALKHTRRADPSGKQAA